ncbi:phytanoyl-CoA dioxygenase family protein [Candidatus Poribacteria bacterium]|nr:phytanoyl-CoA dioxygenase family protein [Candidatus Poribacteria bacterium]
MKNKYVMTDEEKYFFDLTGYLVVREALTPEEVTECNEAVDHYEDKIRTRSVESGGLAHGSSALQGNTGRLELTGMFGWPPPYREPFRRLLVHPVVVSRLNEMSGKGFRLDHGPLMIGAEVGTEGHLLHGSGEPFSQSTWYHQQNGRIFCRGVTVAWQLYDVNDGDGGFAIVPGSHKSRFRTPQGVRTVEDDMGLVVQPVMKAGDVLFFAETATHGTLPWNGKGPRRSILYKYASRAAVRAVGRFFTPEERYGEWTKELTPEQHSLLYGPGHHSGSKKRSALESNGNNVRLVE